MSRPDRSPWTREQLLTLRAMRAGRKSFNEISQATGHSVFACQRKASQLGIGVNGRVYQVVPQFTKPRNGRQSSIRLCLGCKEKFRSEGPHNRQCPRCARRSETVFTHDVRVMRA